MQRQFSARVQFQSISGANFRWLIGRVGTGTQWPVGHRGYRSGGLSSEAYDKYRIYVFEQMMIGRQPAKDHVVQLAKRVESQGSWNVDKDLNLLVTGNPGTGKTYFIDLYERHFLSGHIYKDASGKVLSGAVKKLHSSTIVATGPLDFENDTHSVKYLIIDHAHLLSPKFDSQNAIRLEILERRLGSGMNAALVGHEAGIDEVLAYSPALRSHFPTHLKFPNFDKYERKRLFDDFLSDLTASYSPMMPLRFMRRLDAMSERPSFANAWEIKQVCKQISERYWVRINGLREAAKEELKKAKAEKKEVETVSSAVDGEKDKDDAENTANKEQLDNWHENRVTKEDFLGEEPDISLRRCQAWNELQKMIGLSQIKETVKSLSELVLQNREREDLDLPPIEIPLNRLMLGNPGTGKTTVAQLYGQILKHLGLLSNGDVVVKRPNDFFGDTLGSAEVNTKKILRATVGKVLVIDEAYGLYASGSRRSGTVATTNMYKESVIDTLVGEISNEPGEDRCILLLGYKEQMEEMLNNSNPGLARRFQPEDAFLLPDYNDSELEAILRMKLEKKQLTAVPDALQAALAVLSKQRRRSNFGNAGAVENLIATAIHRKHSTKNKERLSRKSEKVDCALEPHHFDKQWKGSAAKSQENVSIETLFQDFVGADKLIAQLNTYKDSVAMARALGRDPLGTLPLNFLFVGPPGTGKTTAARRFAKVFNSIGILESDEVMEKSASDLIAGYVGQTQMRTRDALRSALGRVLFIDEAYRLANGSFGKESLDEIVDQLTKPEFHGKLVVVMAGYENEIRQLMDCNPGLTSRFSEFVNFNHLSAKDSRILLERQLKQHGILIDGSDCGNGDWERIAENLLLNLSTTSNWGNGRDIVNLCNRMVRHVASMISQGEKLQLGNAVTMDSTDLLPIMRQFLADRSGSWKLFSLNSNSDKTEATADQEPPVIKTDTKTACQLKPDKKKPAPTCHHGHDDCHQQDNGRVVGRDPGVSDADWNTLQKCKADEKAEWDRMMSSLKIYQESLNQAQNELNSISDEYQKASGQYSTDSAELSLLREQFSNAQLVLTHARSQFNVAQKKINQKRENKRELQKRLRAMGVCPAGFNWVHIGGTTYQCEGGAHTIDIGNN